MQHARRMACALAGVGAALIPVLGACESIAGYDGAHERPVAAAAAPAGTSTPDADVANAVDATSGRDGDADADALDIDAAPALDAQPESVPDTGVDAAICPVLTGGNVCARLPRFTAPRQVVDGIGDEFCDIPATVYAVEAAQYKQRAIPGRTYPEIVTYRIAWSTDALHVHVHVADPKLLVATTDALYDGDAVVIHVAGTAALTGAFNGTTDGGAMQVLVSPASGALPARAYTFYWEPGARKTTVDPSFFASRIVADGYEVEMRLPWSTFRDPNAVKVGGAIGIDPGVIVKDDPAAAGQELEATLGFKPLPTGTTTSCTTGTLAPWCDDRTWCSATLE